MKAQTLSLAAALLSCSAASPISLVINLSPAGLSSVGNEICYPLCLPPPAEPDMPKICGEGATPKQFGGCWTCCHSLDSTASIDTPKSKSLTTHQKKVAAFGDDYVNPPNTGLCLRIFIPNKDAAMDMCKGDMVPIKMGEDFWTCCQKAPAPLSTELRTNLVEGEHCLLIHLPPPAEKDMPKICGPLVPFQLPDGFWTCCSPEDSSATIKFKSISTLQKNLSEVSPFGEYVNPPHSDICFLLCVPEEDGAKNMCSAQNTVPVKFGDCFTCCLKPQPEQLTLEL